MYLVSPLSRDDTAEEPPAKKARKEEGTISTYSPRHKRGVDNRGGGCWFCSGLGLSLGLGLGIGFVFLTLGGMPPPRGGEKKSNADAKAKAKAKATTKPTSSFPQAQLYLGPPSFLVKST